MKRNEIWTTRTQCLDAWRTNQIKLVLCSVKYTWLLQNSIASRSMGIILDSRQWLDTIDIFIFNLWNSCYLNNKCEKLGVLLSATLGRPLDVQISLLSTRLRWTENVRPIDVQYGVWMDEPNKDLLWTSLGRVVPIGKWNSGKLHKQLELEHLN